MEYFVMFLIFICLLVGVIGSVIPVLPGPPISYLGLLLSHFFINTMDSNSLFWIGVVVVVVT
ncbi:MAG: DUF456 domain-containing protein, partial [Flavobacteriales bacterium]|nr:DUF456 domain-containing protein [Flavobacteriales bacterium]